MEEEKLQKNIELIEKEKQKYLEEHPEENEDNKDVDVDEIVEEEKEVDITEVSFGDDEIEEWIGKLEELRENKDGHIHLEIDDENELLINYEESEEVEEEE